MSDSTIDKYKERYKEIWREKLDEVVKKNDGQDIEMEKFLKELSDNTPHEEQFREEEDE